MSDRQYQLAVKRILGGDPDDAVLPTENRATQTEVEHLRKRITNLETIRDLQRQTISMLEASLAKARAHV
jgi:hypothetical protein